MKDPKKDWMGEIFYEENGSKIPFIQVPVTRDMPRRLFVSEYKETGEYEPGIDGEDVQKMDASIHQYFEYNEIAKALDPETLDKLRTFFGLEPLSVARKKGQKIIKKVEDNVEDNKKQVH